MHTVRVINQRKVLKGNFQTEYCPHEMRDRFFSLYQSGAAVEMVFGAMGAQAVLETAPMEDRSFRAFGHHSIAFVMHEVA